MLQWQPCMRIWVTPEGGMEASYIAGGRYAGAPRATMAEVSTRDRMGIKLQRRMCSRAHHEAGEHAGAEGPADAQQQLQPVLVALLGDMLPPLRSILQGTTAAVQLAVPACLLMLSAGPGSTTASRMPQHVSLQRDLLAAASNCPPT